RGRGAAPRRRRKEEEGREEQQTTGKFCDKSDPSPLGKETTTGGQGTTGGRCFDDYTVTGKYSFFPLEITGSTSGEIQPVYREVRPVNSEIRPMNSEVRPAMRGPGTDEYNEYQK
ncbi:hypothetical protein PIB30_105612, partial [Stylosanthes scabra]|nr:hypothetical protein [Stylosanthes scabra]